MAQAADQSFVSYNKPRNLSGEETLEAVKFWQTTTEVYYAKDPTLEGFFEEEVTWDPNIRQTMKVLNTRPRGRGEEEEWRTGVHRNTKMYMADSAHVCISPTTRTFLSLRMVVTPSW